MAGGRQNIHSGDNEALSRATTLKAPRCLHAATTNITFLSLSLFVTLPANSSVLLLFLCLFFFFKKKTTWQAYLHFEKPTLYPTFLFRRPFTRDALAPCRVAPDARHVRGGRGG